MTTLAPNSYLLTMPIIENNYNYLNAPTTYGQMELNDTYHSIKTEYYDNPDSLLSSQKQHQHLLNEESTCALSLPSVTSSGQSSPQQSVPTLLMPICGYTSDENNNNSVQIKTEDFQYDQLDFESVSSSEPSPVSASFHDFDIMLNSQQVSQPSYHSHPPQKICNEDDATSETNYPSPGIMNNDLHFDSPYTNYYEGLSRPVSNTTLEQGVQMPMDQMRFIIYEPANATDGHALVPTINSNTSSIVQPPSLWPSMAPVNPSATVPPALSLFDYMPSHHHQSTLPGTSLTPPAAPLPQTHARTHSTTQGQTTQQTPIKCPQPDCPKTFSRLYNLKAHLRSHSPARPYQCPMCPRSFSRKHDLQRHIRVHTGVKPYQCPACHKAFARTDALRRHLKVEPACRESEACQNMKSNRKRYNQDLH